MRFTSVLCTVVCAGAMTATGVQAQEVLNRGTPRTPNDMSSPGHAAFQAQRDAGNANREYLDHAAHTRPPAQRSQDAMQRAARGLLAGADVACEIVEAYEHGQVRPRHSIYEVDCATGAGYVLIEESPVQVFDCAALARGAEQARAANPRAEVGTQCVLEGNREQLASLP
jgi:hypothetical protein